MDVYAEQLKKAQIILQKIGVDALLVEEKFNLYYMTGLQLSAGKLLITLQGATLFVDGRYLEYCKTHSPFPVQLYEPSQFEKSFQNPELAFIHTLAFESDKITHQNFLHLTMQLAQLPQPIHLIPCQDPLRPLRLIKQPQEIEKLRRAADLGSLGFDFVCSLLREGITEAEAALELDIFWKKRGAKGPAFDSIIAFGPNSAMPHHHAGDTYLKAGQIVLVDIGVNLDSYQSDMTRIAFFGSPDPVLLTVHDIVRQAQAAALALCLPGALIGTLDAAARELIDAHGYGAHFTHNLGHGIGLEVHEYPSLKNAPPFKDVALQPGMLITIEPGIYLPGVGGVRIEDTVLITESGHESLTRRSSEAVFI